MINKTTIIDAAIKANILIKNNRSKFPSDLFEGIEQLDQLTSFPEESSIISESYAVSLSFLFQIVNRIHSFVIDRFDYSNLKDYINNILPSSENIDINGLAPLTYDELYYLLKNLDDYSVRIILSSDGNNIFHNVYKAFKTDDVDKFVKTCEDNLVKEANFQAHKYIVRVLRFMVKRNFKKQCIDTMDFPEDSLIYTESLKISFIKFKVFDIEETIKILGNDDLSEVWEPYSKIFDIFKHIDNENPKSQSEIDLEDFEFEDPVKTMTAYRQYVTNIIISSAKHDETVEDIESAILDRINNKTEASLSSEYIQQNEAAPIAETSTKSQKPRLPRPTRLEDNRIGTQYDLEILKALYNIYGSKFINMAEEDFIYFFEGSNKMPSTYNPPYYWNGEEQEMKALLRILYTKNDGGSNKSRAFGRLILMPEDRGSNNPYHNWGKGKHNLGLDRLQTIENNLISIIKNVTGITIPTIDLSRKYGG